MLYLFAENLNPFALALIYIPIFALFIGMICSYFVNNKYLGSVISFFLPLLFTTPNWDTFIANIDACVLWGCLYAFIAFLGTLIKRRNDSVNLLK